MNTNQDLGKFILTFDPEQPHLHYPEMALSAVGITPENLLPTTIPWPANHIPTAAPLTNIPDPADDLTKFEGYDAVVVTWTAAEAATLARLFTPGYPVSSWYKYQHNVAAYIPKVTGRKAPFNDRALASYYHTLALYFPCTIGNKKVLLVKSGLHLDYDGPATPVKTLMAEIAAAVKPKVFVTTGTGGAIGADVLLGDVVIATETRFNCASQFKNEPWKAASYKTSPLPPNVLGSITDDLVKVNAARIPMGRQIPKMWTDQNAVIVTTDFFAYDDSTDHYHLQGSGRACDMGDAMVAQALAGFPDIKFFAIRNASDPQIPNPDGNMHEAGAQSGKIYTKYGALTTAASVIATWAVIH